MVVNYKELGGTAVRFFPFGRRKGLVFFPFDIFESYLPTEPDKNGADRRKGARLEVSIRKRKSGSLREARRRRAVASLVVYFPLSSL